MQRPLLFESDCFIYWKNRFETFVKVKDLDLWHSILNGDFPPVSRNKDTQVLEVVPFEEQSDDLKKKLAKNNEAKMGPKRSPTLHTLKDGPGFSSKNYVRKFLRALHPNGEQSCHGDDSEIYRGKKERVKSIALKAKKESSDDETSTSKSDDEEYVMAVRNFKKFFRRKGKFVRQPREEKKTFRQRDEKKGKSYRKCFRCGDPNHLIGDCPKPPRNKDQKAFIRGSWSDSENDAEDNTNNEACLMAQSSNEVTLNSSYYSDNAYSLDNNKKEITELNEKIKKLERNKEMDITCKSCQEHKLENARLKETQVKFVKFDKSANSLREMLNNQKSSSCKIGLRFDSSKASTSRIKPINFVGSSVEIAPDGSTIKAHGSTIHGSMDSSSSEKVAEHIFSPPISSRSDFVITRKKLIHNKIEEAKKPSLKPSLKSGLGYVKTESRSKTSPPRRNNFSQLRHNTPQPRRNSREPILQNFYPMNWNNNQSQGFVCLRTCLEPDEWIKDNGCSKHMPGNKTIFSTYKAYNGEHVDNLAFSLLSVGQICDNKCRVLFMEEGSEIIEDDKIIGNGIRKNGLYIMKLGNKSQDKLCLATVVDNSTLWHRRLGHTNMRLIQSLSSKELVRNLPKLKYDKHFCDACKIGKQAHASHKAKNMVSTKRCLELLHMDLFGQSAIKSYGGNLYTLVAVDDYSRYTWTKFLKTKNEAFEKFEILSRKIQNQLGSSIVAIRTDHGQEFDNEIQFGAYCDAQGITHNFSTPRTPQSNGVVERKNRTLQEMSRTMLNEKSIPQKFWCNIVDTSTYILNRILIRPILGKTPYEIFRGRKPSFKYFKVFGSKCLILNTKDYLTKFDPKSYECAFLGYSQNSKTYVVLNKHIMKVEELLNVTFDESPPPTKLSPLVDDDVGEEEAIKNNTKVVNNSKEEDESIEADEVVNIKESKNHPLEQVIEPKDVNEALRDEC
ncbi:retrovirus-related pol polyprotein from transposon TNT 1-94 [Tanacetum coccineum]